MYNVETTHAEYQFYSSQWTMSEDFNKGEQAVKDGGTLYLPTPFLNPNDPKTTQAEYEQFKEIAPFLGFSSKTQKGLSGTINRKPINTEDVQSGLEYLITNSNGGKLSLNQHVSRTVEQVTLKGRYGLLTELPISNSEISKADNANGMMPFILGYKPDDIINWQVKDNKLALVVLCEAVEDGDGSNIFGADTIKQYRVLLLEDGVYKQRLYSENNKEEFIEIPVTYGNGQTFDYIPFDFVGAENNDETCDEAPMWPIVVCNKNHYYNSALDQNAVTVASLGMLAISADLDVEQQKEWFPDGITYGARKGYFFPENSTVGFVQANESSAASRNKNEILENAKQIGAQLVEPSNTNETAMAAGIRAASDGSVMSQIAVNTEQGYNSQLENISMVLGSTTESTISLNKVLVTSTMTPADRKQWVEEVMLGITPKSAFYDQMRKSDLIDDSKTNEELEAEIVISDDDSISNTGE